MGLAARCDHGRFADRLVPGPALGDFTQEVLRQFRHVCSWAIQTGGDKTARYDPHYDAEPSGPLALTAADD
jgi:hypothetical protein